MTHEKNLCRVYSIEMDKPTFLLDTNLSLSDRVTPFLFLEMMDKTIKEEEEIGSCWGEGGSFQLTEQLWMALSCNLDVEGNAGRNILSRLKNYYTLLTLHIDTMILTAIILKIVSLQDLSLRDAWAGHWLLGWLKEPWETNRWRRQILK